MDIYFYTPRKNALKQFKFVSKAAELHGKQQQTSNKLMMTECIEQGSIQLQASQMIF